MADGIDFDMREVEQSSSCPTPGDGVVPTRTTIMLRVDTVAR